jgi:hypothetical protein
MKRWHVYVSASGVGITKNDIAKSLYLESIFYFKSYNNSLLPAVKDW